MCEIEFDGEVTLGSKNYKYINGKYFTRYYWYNHTVKCWCGYICIPEKIYNQLNEYYAGNTYLGILGDYDEFHCVIGNDDDYSFNRLQVKLDGMEEQLLEDYGSMLRNEGDNVMNNLIKYHIIYEDEHGPHTCTIEESKLNMILRRLIQFRCYICDIEKV